MTHLKIQQSDSATEQVSSSVITKLYELAVSGTLDASSDLVGRIHTTGTYQYLINGIRAQYPDLYITADNIYAWFEDQEIRNILARELGDGSGVLSTAITSYTGDTFYRSGSSNVYFFSANTSIQTFNEFNQFTNITSLHENSFKGCTNLSSITLPPNLQVIGQQCFMNCSSLDIDLVLPSSVIETGLQAFNNSAIKSITFPQTGFIGVAYFSNNVKYLDLNGMPQLTSIINIPSLKCIQIASCPKLTQITLPDYVESVTFNGDTLLQTITLGVNTQLKKFCSVGQFNSPIDGTSGCDGCSSLTQIVNFPKESFTVLANRTFYGCTSLNDVNNYIGHNCTTIGNLVFYNAGHVGGSYVHIPSSVTSIGNQAFFGFTISKCPGFIFHSTTPPTIGTSVFQESYSNTENNTTNFYVPYSAVSAYQAVQNFIDEPTNRTWKYKDKVKGYKIYQYSSSTWNEISSPTETQIETASANMVNGVPSASTTDGTLAFAIIS